MITTANRRLQCSGNSPLDPLDPQIRPGSMRAHAWATMRNQGRPLLPLWRAVLCSAAPHRIILCNPVSHRPWERALWQHIGSEDFLSEAASLADPVTPLSVPRHTKPPPTSLCHSAPKEKRLELFHRPLPFHTQILGFPWHLIVIQALLYCLGRSRYFHLDSVLLFLIAFRSTRYRSSNPASQQIDQDPSTHSTSRLLAEFTYAAWNS